MLDPGRDDCRTCGRFELARTPLMPMVGTTPCDILIVGEAPGREEDWEGRPFVGKSGRLLHETLRQFGFDALGLRVAYTNTVRCATAKNRKPSDKERKLCAGLLEADIDQAAPRMILALGAVAFKALCGRTGIMAQHGQLFEHAKRPLPVFAALHPAFVLHDPNNRQDFERDIERFVSLLRPETIRTITIIAARRYTLVLDEATRQRAMAEAFAAARAGLVCGFDTEFRNLDELRAPRELLGSAIGWFDGDTVRAYFLPDEHPESPFRGSETAKRDLALWLRTAQLAVHNAEAEAVSAWDCLGVHPKELRIVADTMQYSIALHGPDAKNDLKHLAVKDTDLGGYEREVDDFKRLSRLHAPTIAALQADPPGKTTPARVRDALAFLQRHNGAYFHDDDYGTIPLRMLATPYGCGDVDATLQCYRAYRPQLEQQGQLPWVDRVLVPMWRVNMMIRRNGLDVDEPEALTKRAFCVAQMEAATDAVLALPAVRAYVETRAATKKSPFSLNSDDQVRACLFTLYNGVPSGSTTATTRVPKLDREAIELMLAQKQPKEVRVILEARRRYKGFDKMRGTAIDGFLKRRYPDGRVHSRIHNFTWSGRRGSSKPNCFSGDTEVLTETGWLRLDQLVADPIPRAVAQWAPPDRPGDVGTISFVHPSACVLRPADDALVHLTNQHIDLAVTPDHRCLVRSRRTGQLRVVPADQYPEDAQQIHAGRYDGPGLPLSDAQLRLLIAAQGDGHFTARGGGLDFRFKKRRKIQRLEGIVRDLVRLGILARAAVTHVPGGRRFYFRKDTVPWVRDFLGPAKQLGAWLLQASHTQLELVANELFLWDGCATRMNHYASKDPVNTQWAATVLALTGHRTHERIYTNRQGSVSHQVDIVHRDYSMTTNVRRGTLPPQPTYCVSVPSSFILVRRGGAIHVTGQCQNIPDGRKVKSELAADVPPDTANMRMIIRAAPGTHFVGGDYGQLEFRLAACYARDPNMLAACRQGDPHAMLQQALAELQDDAGRPIILPREPVKRINFGIIYGCDAVRVQAICAEEGIAISHETAQKIVDRTWALYPRLRTTIDETEQHIRDHKFVTTPIGHIRWMENVDSTDERLAARALREGWNHCVDSATECLTPTGWVRGDAVRVGDRILTKNPNTGVLEWNRIRRVVRETLPTVEFRHRSISAVTSHGHRWLVDRRGEQGTPDQQRFVTTADMDRYGRDSIHRCGVWHGPGTGWSRTMLQLAGWFLTDGTATNQHTFTLCQAKPDGVRAIDRLLRRVPHRRRVDARDGTVYWRLRTSDTTRQIRAAFPSRVLTPAFLFQLSGHEARTLWNTMVAGDGHTDARGAVVVYTGRDRHRAEMFQLLTYLTGKSARIHAVAGRTHQKGRNMRNVPVSRRGYRVQVLRRTRVQVTAAQRRPAGVRDVWCPVVTNQTFVARRRGHIYITGNCNQSLGHDILNVALDWLQSVIWERDLPWEICADLHDDFLMRVPDAHVDDACHLVKYIMEEAPRRLLGAWLQVPLTADPRVGTHYGTMTKHACPACQHEEAA